MVSKNNIFLATKATTSFLVARKANYFPVGLLVFIEEDARNIECPVKLEEPYFYFNINCRTFDINEMQELVDFCKILFASL